MMPMLELSRHMFRQNTLDRIDPVRAYPRFEITQVCSKQGWVAPSVVSAAARE